MRELAGIVVCSGLTAALMSAILPLLPIAVRDATGSTARSGVVTAAVALGTIVMELQTPRVLRRWRVQTALVAGFCAIGGALVGLSLLPHFPAMVVLGVLFGLGFGLNITVGSIVVAKIGDERGRNEALLLYAGATTVPAILTPPIALLAVQHVHLEGVFAAGAALAVFGLLCASLSLYEDHGPPSDLRVRATIANGRVMPVLVAFTCVTFTYGATVTLVPLAIRGPGLGSAVTFFLAFGIFRTAGRIASAAALHHVSPVRLLVPGIVLSALGLGCLAVGGLAVDLLAAVVFGLGFGAVQTASLVAMLDRERPDAASPVTALWNVGIDGGTGFGAVVMAPLAAAIGFRWTFAVASGLALGAAALGAPARRRAGSSRSRAGRSGPCPPPR